MLRARELEYDLPPELIATSPVSPRDSARLLVVDRARAAVARHGAVRDLPELLRAGDVLVFNTTRVLPARFFARRLGTGGKVEGLYLLTLPEGEGWGGESVGIPAPEPSHAPSATARWLALLRGRHLRPGAELELLDVSGRVSPFTLTVTGRQEPGAWTTAIYGPGGTTAEILEQIGHTPLPPYIVKARQHAHQPSDDALDRERYQTVYADRPGSVAAPTAGLHFTPDLLDALRGRGVGRLDVLLHVGAGTFKPIETEVVEDHPMHAEWCSISPVSIRAILDARSQGRRIIAVGTTAARTLESYAAIVEAGAAPPESIETRLLITPGYTFRWVDGLLTNFHLPRSTLLAMVAAFLPPPSVAALNGMYAEAIAARYRFYSYGDAMLII